MPMAVKMKSQKFNLIKVYYLLTPNPIWAYFLQVVTQIFRLLVSLSSIVH